MSYGNTEILELSDIDWEQAEEQGSAHFVRNLWWDVEAEWWSIATNDDYLSPRTLDDENRQLIIDIVEAGEREVTRLLALTDLEMRAEFLLCRDEEIFLKGDWARANFEEAALIAPWTADEAAALILDRAHDQFESRTVLKLPANSPFRVEFIRVQKLIMRAASSGQIGAPDRIEPNLLYAWLSSNKLLMNSKFYDLCREFSKGAQVNSPQARNDIVSKKELRSLYYIIIGLAVNNHHKFSSKISQTRLSHIEFDFDIMDAAIKAVGLKLDDNTLRRKFKSAVDFLQSEGHRFTRNKQDNKPNFVTDNSK